MRNAKQAKRTVTTMCAKTEARKPSNSKRRKQLHEEANVPEGLCGLDEVNQFQEFLQCRVGVNLRSSWRGISQFSISPLTESRDDFRRNIQSSRWSTNGESPANWKGSTPLSIRSEAYDSNGRARSWFSSSYPFVTCVMTKNLANRFTRKVKGLHYRVSTQSHKVCWYNPLG